jgi:hypothetical protein
MPPEETTMPEPKDPRKRPAARETKGEGVPKRKRNESPDAEERAEPKRGDERVDGRLIERERDAHNPEGI